MKDKILINSIATILVIFFGYIAHDQYFKTKNNVINLYSDKQSIIAYQAALSMESIIMERLKAIEVLADIASSRKTDNYLLLKEYKRTYEKIKGFDFILNVNTNGKAIYGYPENFPCPLKQRPEMRARFLETFYKARDKKETMVFSKNELVDGKVLICLITPIFSNQDKFQGAVVGVLDVKEAVNEALKPIIEIGDDYSWILNEQGYLLYHPTHEEMLFRNVFKNQETCLKCHKKFAIEKQMLSTSRGVGVKFNLQTEKQLIGYAPIYLKNTKWIIAVSSPFKKVATAIRGQFRNLLLLILFMITTVIIGAILINRATTKQISALNELENLKIRSALIQEKNAAESRYRLLVEQSPDPIFLCTRRKFITINRSFEKLFGYSEKELMSSEFNMWKLVAPSIKEKFIKDMKKFVRNKKQFASLSLTMLSKNGVDVDVEVSLGRFLFGHKIVYQGITHDVTKIKQLEREREQRKYLSVIGEMSTRIAHEIKNPLASIQTGIQLLESQMPKDDLQKSYYERLRREIQRVDTILKGLLSYARDEKLNLNGVPITPLINKFKQMILPTIKKHNLKLFIHFEKDLPKIYIDEQKIEQVLWNIILNAVQASNRGSIIRLNVSAIQKGIALEINDQGQGIPEHNLSKIFNPFFSTRTHGSGLGLAISKKIIEQHGGSLQIKSKLNHGTTVIIELPKGNFSV